MANTVKRVNYYDHQFLRAPDFVDEQNYHLNSRRLHNSTLHTWGIVQGLTVSVASGGTGTAVTVTAGMAIDSAGREIILPADTNLELGGETAGSAPIITIAYSEVQSDPTTEAGGPGNTRISEIPNLSFTEVTPADRSVTLILARVPRTNTGLGAVDASDRKQAGVVLGSNLTVNTLTLSKDGIAQANWPALSCSGANQAVLANAGLSLLGPVSIGPAAADRSLSISGAGAAGVFANIKNASNELLLGVDTSAVLSAMTNSDLQIRTNNVTRMTIAKGDGNTQIQSTLIVGPIALPTATGRITVTGPVAELGFAKRSLTSWAAAPAAGDRYVWYNPDGNAKLYTEANGDLLTVTPGGFLGIGTVPTRALDVRASGGIKLGLEGNGGGQLIITNNPNDNCVYLEAFNSAGNGNATQMFLTGANGSNVPLLSFNADRTTVDGDLLAGGSDVYFTKTNHSHVGFGNAAGYAAIENDGGVFNALMILGRTVTTNPLSRVVKMWDHFEMNGDALKPGGGAWGALSDEALKTNINPLSAVLDKLLNLRGVTFNWKEPEKYGNLAGPQTGFVAQQVEDVFPEWVGRDSGGFRTVSIRGFEALTVEAFRELRDELRAVQNALENLTSKVAAHGH
jgi:hypothetical protein